jgi:hypothetical protein
MMNYSIQQSLVAYDDDHDDVHDVNERAINDDAPIFMVASNLNV